MKRKPLTKTLSRLLLCLLFIPSLFFVSCSDDPESTNEEEVITTFIVTLDPTEGVGEEAGNIVTLTWDDSNVDGIVDASEIVVSDALLLNETYEASIQLLNKSGDLDIDITAEVEEEADDHIFCYTKSENLTISFSNFDKDSNNLSLGLTSTWTVGAASEGTVTIALRHQPGVKTGDCPGAGETDASITFPIQVISQDPE